MKHLLLALIIPVIPGIPGRAVAADLSISAEVNKTIVALNEQVQMQVEVRGGSLGLPDPQLPSMPNFSIFSSGRSQNISMVNGSVQSSLTFSYYLVPRFVGKAVIGPIVVEEGGQRAQTNPIEIQVTRPSGQNPNQTQNPNQNQQQPHADKPRGPDLFVEAQLDKKRAFVNEQVVLTVRLYSAVPLMGNVGYQAPDITGFFYEDLPPVTPYSRTIHGREYHVAEVRHALFPVGAGRRTIGTAIIKAPVQENMKLDPYAADFFQKFLQFGGNAKEMTLKTDPITLEVDALPEEGKPRDFNGTVGRYSISALLSRGKVKVGDAIDMALIVEGNGNLKTVVAPKLPELKSFRVYDTLSSLSVKTDGNIVHGSRTFKTVIVPRASGELSIPAIAFSYFDPMNKIYETKTVGPLKITVEPSDEPDAQQRAQGIPGSNARGATQVESDIEYIRDRPLRHVWSGAVRAFAHAGPLHAVPVLAWLGCLAVFGVRQRRQSLDPKYLRFAEALKTADRRLKDNKGATPDAAVPLLQDTLSGYLGDKLGIAAKGLTLRQITAELKGRVHVERLTELQSLWQELDALRYAPSGTTNPNTAQDLFHRTEALLHLLEKELE